MARRGGAACGPGWTGAHLLSVFPHDLGIPLDLEPVERKRNEIPAAPSLLQRLPLAGRIVLVDAWLTQEAIAAALAEAGVEYVMPVKGNQPGLAGELRQLFAKPLPKTWRREEAQTGEGGARSPGVPPADGGGAAGRTAGLVRGALAAREPLSLGA